MKIGFDAKRAFHNSSGLGNYSRDLIRILSYDRINDSLLLFNPKPSDRSFDYNKENTFEVNPIRGFYKKGSSLWRRFRLANLAKKHRCDLFIGLSNELPFGIEKSGVKSIVVIHDLIFERYPEWYNPLDVQIYRKKFKSAIEASDKVVAISEQTKSDIVEFYKTDPSKIEVIYQGCHPAFQNEENNINSQSIQSKFGLPENFIISVGTIESRKNLKVVVEAISKLNDINLVIVGKKTKYADELFQWAKDHEMENRLIHLKNVSMDELANLYKSAKLFVYPSIFEGFGIPIIEALFSGTPVITSKGGCFKEAGGPDSIYLDPHNSEEWKTAINNIWNNSERRNEMSLKGIEHAQNFTDSKVLSSWNSMIDSIVNS